MSSSPDIPSNEEQNSLQDIMAKKANTTVAAPIMPKLWSPGKGQNAAWYYDEPLPTYQLDKGNDEHEFPPDNLDLSDAWVVKLMRSNLNREDRHARWPTVFAGKYLVSSYLNKGRASKTLTESDEWHYDVVNGKFQMFGREGVQAGLSKVLDAVATSKNTIGVGEKCKVQNNTFAYPKRISKKSGTATDAPKSEISPIRAAIPASTGPIGEATASVPPTEKNSSVPVVETSTPSKQPIVVPSGRKEGFTSKKRKVLPEKLRASVEAKIEAKRQNPGSSTPAKEFTRNKRVKIGSFLDDRSSDRGSVSSAPPLFHVRDVVDSSEEEQGDLAAQVKKLQEEKNKLQDRLNHLEQRFVQENGTLRDRLDQAEGKFVLLATTASKIHEVIQPLVERTTQAADLFLVVSKVQPFLDATEQKVKDRKGELEEMRVYRKENSSIVRSLLASSQAAVDELYECFPTLVDRLFHHSTEDVQNLRAWISGTFPDYGKLTDENDETVDNTGSRVTEDKDKEDEESKKEDDEEEPSEVNEEEVVPGPPAITSVVDNTD